MPSTNPNIPWDSIDTVLLDMDGTLLDLYFDWHFWMTFLPQAYANKNQLSLEEANRIIHQKIQEIEGTLNWYCLDYWTQTFELPVVALKREIKHMIQTHPEVITFLQRLKMLNKRLIMVTNAHRDSLTLKLEMTDIGDYFDQMISAHDFGIPKENGEIWQKIQEVAPFDPQRTLLIDDNLRALKTAQEFGIAHLLAATHVSAKMDKINPEHFEAFESYLEIMPQQPQKT
ncbi:GMP/IMP nucleotidase [Thiosulfativibrio zosterae]|uniref:Hydrolase n=1 Tax=Thiosulfativibrio zosterae TaxID=2675053 RepID=A0A6F8PPU5_9GAMM|nr:GMP/IMP nucleotidase [Thiosulfativibrio zosterae]BBP44139.1 hydrolase [Thiosulfativibrio zosterae]